MRRIAINVGAGYVPGMNAVLRGAARAAGEHGWEIVGIRDGFEGLLHPEKYPEGGLVTLGAELIENLDPAASGVLGQASRVDPFHVRTENDDGMIEEVDQSDELLARIRAEKIDAVISVVGGRGISILYKLHRKGLNTVCIPLSIENDIASTLVSFGFNSALTFTIEMLDRVRQAAQSARRIAVVEVLGRQSGWLALQAGFAAGADVVLIPEIACDLDAVAAKLKRTVTSRRPYGLVVAAEGVKVDAAGQPEAKPSSYKASLSPLATGDASDYVINTSGRVAEALANGLQLRIANEIHPLVLGPWVRGGAPTAVDRQLGVAYGVGAIRALEDADRTGVMVAFVPPEIRFVPLAESVNKVRTVPMDSMFIQVARSLDICLGRDL